MNEWPIFRQMRNRDIDAFGDSAASPRSDSLASRTKTADRAVASVCPYCAVGCGQLVYVKDEDHRYRRRPAFADLKRLPLSKGAATFQLVTGSHRVHHVLYRRPYGKRWERFRWSRPWTWSPSA